MKLGKIMVIDHDPEFLEELKRFLGAKGCKVVPLENGSRAVGTALEEKPDAILVELSAGPGGGLRTAERLRRACGTSKIPVVYMTAYFSVLSENPDIRICLKRHFNPGRVVRELISLLEDK